MACHMTSGGGPWASPVFTWSPMTDVVIYYIRLGCLSDNVVFGPIEQQPAANYTCHEF